MGKKLKSRLRDKQVVQKDGTDIGTFVDVRADLRTETLTELVVSPDPMTERSVNLEKDMHGNYLIDASRVNSVKNSIVIE